MSFALYYPPNQTKKEEKKRKNITKTKQKKEKKTQGKYLIKGLDIELADVVCVRPVGELVRGRLFVELFALLLFSFGILLFVEFVLFVVFAFVKLLVVVFTIEEKNFKRLEELPLAFGLFGAGSNSVSIN